ncbi:MAG TPA: hypothetical protein VM099_07225, partial [Gemmatimonadaceae bacterium]|nr:hypothetical protein [Gemmatimonadaceae bacterium]
TDAARIGYSVTENVERLLRLHWTERRMMDVLLAHIASTPEWELKCAMCLHQWHAAEHTDALRKRISEMRHPVPPLDRAPHTALENFFAELIHSADTTEFLSGMYRIALPALRQAYSAHVARTNPLVDHPTIRMMTAMLLDLEQSIAWGESTLVAMTADDDSRARATAWEDHLKAYLSAARGIAGDASAFDGALPPARAGDSFEPEFHPKRDDRFHGQYNFTFPPHLVYNAPGVPADERNLALLCKRTLEMDVPEMMASFLYERKDQPWTFYHDYSRQLWDEARHAMMGTVALNARRIDWTQIPLNVGFSTRLNLHASPLERQILLYAIEQSLMPGETGKRFEYETAREAGDDLSAHFHDYDWADEVLHAQIGRRALAREGILQQEALERAKSIHEKTWAALDQYRDRDEQLDWWPEFVRDTLGKESAAKDLGEPNILSE